MRLRFMFGLITLMLLLSSSPVWSETLDQVLSRSDYSQEAREDIRRLFESAAAGDIPNRMLLPRLAEGIAKNVPARRVISVLQRDVERLKRAKELLSAADPEGDLVETTAAWSRTNTLLTAGVSPDLLETIARAAADEPASYRPATNLYVSLTDWGLAPQLAADVSAAMVRSDIAPERYPTAVEILTEARRSRMDPDRVAQELIRLLPESSRIQAVQRQLGL